MAQPAPPPTAPPPTFDPPALSQEDSLARVRVVVVVDESNSLSTADVDEERLAAQIIVSSADIDPASEVAVVGFGSSDGPGQEAAVARCPLAPVGGTDFDPCLGELHRRDVGEGGATDHTAALRLTLDIMDEPGGQGLFKLVFFLTDGAMRVDNSPQYGQNPASRNTEARRQLEEDVLPDAKRAGVQIWPLGFGGGIDEAGLRTLAEGGAGPNPDCGPAGIAVQPEARVARDAGGIGATLLAAFANAACSRTADPIKRALSSGRTTDLLLEVEPAAANISINVAKREPAVRVAYFDPMQRDVTAATWLDGSSFRLAGVGSTAESLRVTNPIPGTWTVRLTAPAQVQGQVAVAATLLWKGRLRADVTIEPSSPAPGQPFVVRIRLRTSRYVPIASSELPPDLRLHATVRGDGFDPLRVELGDAPDAQAGDGEFAGQAVLPAAASGQFSVEGTVEALGFAPTTGSTKPVEVILTDSRVPPESSPTAGEPPSPWYQTYWYLWPLLVMVVVLGGLLAGVLARQRALGRGLPPGVARWGMPEDDPPSWRMLKK